MANSLVVSFFNFTLVVDWTKMGRLVVECVVEDFDGQIGIGFARIGVDNVLTSGNFGGLLTDRFKATFSTCDFVTSDFVTTVDFVSGDFVSGDFVVLLTRMVDGDDGVRGLREVVEPVWMRSASGHSSFTT